MVSVIVTVYNIDSYLDKCIISLINQTYKDFEVVLIDDGSTDMSGVICDKYASQYKNVNVFHKENGGVSDARNYGIQHSGGEYIAFVDGDDFVSEFFLEIMMNGIMHTKCKIAALTKSCDFWDDEDNNVVLVQNSEEYQMRVEESIKVLENTFYYKMSMGMQFRVYKREIFNDVTFPVGWLYEDPATFYKLYLKIDSVCVITADVYAYRKRMGSIVRNAFNEKKMTVIDITEQIINDISESDKCTSKTLNAAYDRAFCMNFSVYLQIPLIDIENRTKIWNKIIEYRKFVILNKDLRVRMKDRIAAWMTFGGMHISYILGKKFGQRGNMN